MMCTSTAQLQGTGLDTPTPSECNDDSLEGGGTGWLTTTAPVTPGETLHLRFMIFDEGDHIYDSAVILDNFRWQATAVEEPTTIPRLVPPRHPYVP